MNTPANVNADPANLVFHGKWLELYRVQPHYEYIHRYKKPKAVAIFAMTGNFEIIAVEQARHPFTLPVIEAPAGHCEEGEASLVTAYRELMEETGYGNGTVVNQVFNVPTTPGICTEMLDLIYLIDVKKIGEGGGLEEENEHIIIHVIPIKDIDAFMESKKDKVLFDMKFIMLKEWAKGYFNSL